MAVYTIQVSQPANDSMGASFKELLGVLSKIKKPKKNDVINIDCSKLSFVFPFLILPLSAIINSLKENNIEVNLIKGGNCTSYLNTIHFPHGINPVTTLAWENVLQSFSAKTYLPVCVIPAQEHMSSNRELLFSIFENILTNQLNLKGQLKISISYLLSEAITNIVDHAEVENGYMMVQNYPAKEFLDICIADTGVGILKTYKSDKFPDIISDEQAIAGAVTGKSTKKTGCNPGIRHKHFT